MERLQAAEECVNAEQKVQSSRQAPTWTLPFTPTWTPEAKLKVGLLCPHTCVTEGIIVQVQ